MNKLYVFGPMAGLLLFGAAYWRFERSYEARQVAHEERLRAEVDRVLRQQAAERTAAHVAAVAARERRLRERAEAEELAAAQQATRETAERNRLVAIERARKLEGQVDRLRAETEYVSRAVAAAEEDRRMLQAEYLFLLQCVDEAEANRKGFIQLLDKVERLERDRAGGPATPAGRGGVRRS